MTPLPRTLSIGGPYGARTGSVNPDGTFEFPAVLPGVYSVRFMLVSDNFARTITVGKTDPALVEVPLTLPSVKISGRVTGENQLKQQGQMKADESIVPVLLRGATASRDMITAEKSPDGTFVFPKVQAGTYTLGMMRTCLGCDYASIGISGRTIVVGDIDIIGIEIPAN